MRFDSIIIGGGVAGLCAGLRLVEAGRKTLIMASGQSALHFSSGSVDLLGGEGDPREALQDFIDSHPDHPYAKVGHDNVLKSLLDLQTHCAAQGLTLVSGERNHHRLTPIGTLKSTWLSPDTCAVVGDTALPDTLLLATLEGFRDFHPALAAANLARQSAFRSCKILTGELRLPQLAAFSRNPHEFRSADIARLCDRHDLIKELASEISRLIIDSGTPCSHVILPACLTLGLVGPRLAELEKRTGCTIREVATMPPSLIGMRLQESLKQRFLALGGTFLTSERVQGAHCEGDRVVGLFSQNGEDILFEADHFVLATGSFFSRGLESRLRGIREPIFGADVLSDPERDAWAGRRLFDHHPFMGFGVKTDEQLRVLRGGTAFSNLYAAGSVLAHYDPIREGSGSGVAVATGWQAAGHILGAL